LHAGGIGSTCSWRERRFERLCDERRAGGRNEQAIGTASTRMVINRLRVVGNKVVGVGMVIAKYTRTSGVTTVKRNVGGSSQVR